jgi:pimeloyl-ACP methyl ester carboxylesterase
MPIPDGSTPGIDRVDLAVNGIRMHCARAGGGQLILFLHGFPEFWRAWRRQLEHFGARGWLAAAPDLRGYDLSDKPADVAQYRMKHLVEDVRQLGAALVGEGTPFVLVGHDWGGAPAWGMAAAYPELVSRLVIVNSPHPYTFWRELTSNPAQQQASRYMLYLRDARAEERLSEDGHRKLWELAFGGGRGADALLDEEYRAAWHEAWSRPGALTGALNWYRASPLYPPTPEDPGPSRLSLRPEDFTVRVPTLVLWGERDRALLPGCLDGLDACVPDLEVVRVPDASHWIVHERSDLVNRTIEEFIARGMGGRARREEEGA